MSNINENPHRLSGLSKVSIPQLVIEGDCKKFGYTLTCGDTHTGHVIGLTFVLFVMGLLLTGLVVLFTPNLVTPAFTFAFPSIIVLTIMELFFPVPYAVITKVITDVKRSEKKKSLEPSESWWIYTYYFVLRNHPFLNKWIGLLRMFIILSVPVAGTLLLPTVGFGLLIELSCLLYISYKLAYVEK